MKVRRLAAALVAAAALLPLSYSALVAIGDDAAPPPDEWKAPARAARKKNPIAADAASVATGKAIFVKQCLSCHGPLGKGDGPQAKDLQKKPGDLSNPKLWEQTDGALFWKISEGKKPMPTFEKLTTEEERWNVINYVRTLSPAPATQAKGDTQ
jgi:mono/diheme cytochrome c family protein